MQLYARSGDETLVNTVTQYRQMNPKITRLSTGGYVVLWTDESLTGGDTSGFAVKAQIFDSAGGKVGGQFLVNTATGGHQTVESVAMTPDGGFVAVFRTVSNTLKAQIFDSSGAKVGGELVVAAAVPNSAQTNSHASATVLADGTVIVAWGRSDPGNGDHIFARAFSATGAAVGSEFRIDTAITPSLTPSITALASGGWVATWYSWAASGVVGQLFAADGAKVGGEFTVDSGASSPVVTALSGGGFVVGWGEDDGANDGTLGGVRARIFDGSGAALGPAFQVNSIIRGFQGDIGIDDMPGGGFVVTWTDLSGVGRDWEAYGIMAQLFDSAGEKVGTQFLVDPVTQGGQELSQVAALASGTLVVVWQAATDDSPYPDVKAQLFTPYAGTATDIALSPASVSETAIGNYAVATLSDNGGVNSAKTYALLADSTGGAFRIEGNRLIV
ncbi:MAG TPA: hypothetical protein VEW26_16265, partial [Allosphingosinicella sp.]|nr:hypothetical protein [Allosphingosinicella sp.]